MVPIYTRVGDGGFTQFPRKGAEPLRVPKDDPRVAALGELDAFNAHLGWCLAACAPGRHELIREALTPVQADLFRIGASLANLAGGGDAPVRLKVTEVAALERTIDRVFAALPPLTHFVLPGGSELAARLHVTRTVCRQAERAVVTALNEIAAFAAPPAVGLAKDARPTLQENTAATSAEPSAFAPVTELILRYLNRLSDLLFALARQANADDGAAERIWQP
jgi:cob(I)alamin adenosyltransferase